VRRSGEIDRGVCRSVAASRFSAKRMAADHLRFYQSVLGQTPKRVQVA